MLNGKCEQKIIPQMQKRELKRSREIKRNDALLENFEHGSFFK